MNSGAPKVSVLMAVYNGEKYLRESIDSILHQTFRDFEFVIVDDCSTDSTPGILAEYANSDQRVRVLRNETNRGLAKSLNVGIAASQGEYIARMDADDVCILTRLAEQVSYLESHPESPFVASAAYYINERGVRTGFRPAPIGTCTLKLTLTLANPLIHPSVIFRADTARELNGYSEEDQHRFSEDSEFWSRIVLCGKARALPQPLVDVRLYPSSVSAVNGEEQSRQGECAARITLERILGREVDDLTWSAWRRFTMTAPGHAASFDANEVRALRLLVSGMIQSVQHDRGGPCKLPWLWAKHALALAVLRRGDIAARARLRLAAMALQIGIEALVAHR